MINYLSYFIYFFGNLIIVIFVPDTTAQIFLSIYSFSSLIIGPISFIFFSKYLKKNIEVKVLIILINFSLFLFYENDRYLYFIYTLNLFFCDLFSSQAKSQKLNFLFKIIFFLTVIPFILNFFSFEFLIFFRIFLCSLLLTYLLINNLEYTNLQIGYPYFYQLLTNLNYFGTLFILTLLFQGPTLKFAFIFFQVNLSIMLKLYDLKIRKIIDKNIFEKLFKLIVFLFIFVPLFSLVLEIPKLIMILYYLSFIITISVRYIFLTNE